jgi:hypothetical protein
MNWLQKLLWRIRFAVPIRETALIRERIEAGIKCGAVKCPYGILWRRFSGKCPHHFLEGDCTDCSEGKWFAERKTNTRRRREESRKKFLNTAIAFDPSIGQVSRRINPAVPFHHSKDRMRLQKRKLWFAGLSGETASHTGLLRLIFVFSEGFQDIRNPENTERQNRPAGFPLVPRLIFFATLLPLPGIVFSLFFPEDRKAFLALCQILFSRLTVSFVLILHGTGFFRNLASGKRRAG